MHHKPLAKEQRQEISDLSTTPDWSGLVVELEQSEKACNLAIDLLKQIISSLQVSRLSVLEQELRI